MSDSEIAKIARSLAAALLIRAKSRSAEDQKFVLGLQTELCQAVMAEMDEKVDAH